MKSIDDFGLTTSMHAAALGNLDAVKAAHELSPLFETRNPRTNANLPHYAAQALSGGADIIKWAILEANAPMDLLSQRILMHARDRITGNGHTVAMEAVFNGNAEVIEALIEIRDSGRVVDLTTPALTGWTPRGFALRESLSFASDLPPLGQTFEDARDAARQFAKQEDDNWVSAHPGDKAAIDLAAELRSFVVNDVAGDSIDALLRSAIESGVNVNERYGRLGQPLLNLVPTGLSANVLQANQQTRYAKVVSLLIEAGADPRNKEIGLMQVSAGFRDAVFGYRAGLKLMLESIPQGADRQAFVNEQGIMNGYTRLIDAALFGRADIVDLLLDYNVDRNLKGFNGRSAYDAAVTYNKRDIGNHLDTKRLE